MILCKPGKAEEALQRMREIMGKLKLTVNEEKTRICKVPEGEFDLLGYTFGRRYSAVTGKAYTALWPSKKSIRRRSACSREHRLPGVLPFMSPVLSGQRMTVPGRAQTTGLQCSTSVDATEPTARQENQLLITNGGFRLLIVLTEWLHSSFLGDCSGSTV